MKMASGSGEIFVLPWSPPYNETMANCSANLSRGSCVLDSVMVCNGGRVTAYNYRHGYSELISWSMFILAYII